MSFGFVLASICPIVKIQTPVKYFVPAHINNFFILLNLSLYVRLSFATCLLFAAEFRETKDQHAVCLMQLLHLEQQNS